MQTSCNLATPMFVELCWPLYGSDPANENNQVMDVNMFCWGGRRAVIVLGKQLSVRQFVPTAKEWELFIMGGVTK